MASDIKEDQTSIIVDEQIPRVQTKQAQNPVGTLAFHEAVQKQAENRILRFTQTPKIDYAVSIKDKNPFLAQ